MSLKIIDSDVATMDAVAIRNVYLEAIRGRGTSEDVAALAQAIEDAIYENGAMSLANVWEEHGRAKDAVDEADADLEAEREAHEKTKDKLLDAETRAVNFEAELETARAEIARLKAGIPEKAPGIARAKPRKR